MSKLIIEKIIKIYKKKRVVDEVSFHVSQGEVVGLLGPNGAGKTTSFYIAVGLVKPEMGSVYFDNTKISNMAMYERARLGIGYLPQEASVFRKMSVEDNIYTILEVQKMSKKKQKERCEELLESFNITHIRKQKGYALSGGERRRIEIARAMAANPKILLLDEPFAGVDPIAVKDIQNIIRNIQKLNIGILITDHNVRETLKIISRAYIMSSGKVLIQGTADELINNEDARRIYLGDDFTL